MKAAVLIVALAPFLVQKTSANCRPAVISQKGFRLDTPTDIFVDFHGDCEDEITVGATLTALPRRIDNHDSNNTAGIRHDNKSVKLTLTPKSQKLQEHRGEIDYRAQLTVDYCEGPNCKDLKNILTTIVALNKTYGYVFLTIDRPAYRPGEKVNIKFALTDQNLKAGSPRNVTITIKTPNDKGRIAVDTKNEKVLDGFGDYIYNVPSDPIVGVWWIEAHLNRVKMAEKSFLIDRYTLPTFQVKIKPDRYFILPTDQSITGTLTAEYSYGKKVSGSYYMSFRLKRADGTEIEFLKIPKRYNLQARIQVGESEYNVSIGKLKGILKPGESLESFANEGKASVVILASVTGEVESVFESDYVENIIFARSPYLIDYARSAKFYAPNRVYDLQFTVKDVVSHLPVPGVNVTISWDTPASGKTRNTDEHGKVYLQIDSFEDNTEKIKVKPRESQFETIIVVEKQQLNRQLDLELKKPFAELGDFQQIEFDVGNASPKNIRFFVISRGQIVHAKSKILQPGRSGEVSDTFKVTAAMVPHARVVAYYVHEGSVTSQSAFFEVKNACETELVVEPKDLQVKPGDPVSFKVTGAQNSEFIIKAVDRAAYFVHNGTRLNRNVLWRDMEEYDTACSVQGGRNSKNVFEEAGLSFNGIDIAGSFQSMFCVPESRKKRSTSEVQILDSDNTVTEEQCEAGGREQRYDVPCENRIRFLRKNLQKQGKTDENIEDCVAWFEAICRSRRANSYLARSVAEAKGRAEENREKRRHDFAENWISGNQKIDGSGEKKINVKSRHSITFFDIDAYGMSKHSPMCIAKSTSVKVFQDVFIQLYLPYSVRVREQAQIRFSVFNYGDKFLENMEIKIKNSKELCSKYASSDFKHFQYMNLPKGTEGKALAFSIMPMKIPVGGTAKIEVKIPGYDHIVKELLIEEPGQHNDSDHTMVLQPDEEDPDRLVRAEDIVFDIPKTGVMPNSEKCWIYAYSHPMGPNIQLNEFDGQLANVGNLVRQPGGCGEQNMIRSGPTIFVHEYRFAVWKDDVTQAQTDQAINSIKNCYSVELNHLSNPVKKKAFAVWASHMPSTWLNAFVVKVFSAGKKIWPEMDAGPLCNALDWMMNQQQNDGQFNSGYSVYHQEMIGQVKDPITLAAYVSISLQESKTTCPLLSSRIYRATYLAMKFFKKKTVQARTNTYTLAIGAYALSIIDPFSTEAREWNTFLREKKRNEGEYVYWHGNHGIASDIEVTGYALLAEVSLNGINEENDLLTRNIAYWLISKRNANGGFKSTQDTVVALQALAKHRTVLETSDIKPPKTDMRVTIRANSEDSIWHREREPKEFHLGVEDTHKRKEYEVPRATIADGAKVLVSGNGTGALTYRCTWRQYAEDGICNFNITVSIVEDPDGAESVKILKVFVSKPEEPKAPMSIIDVGLLTGFQPNENSLKKLCTDEVVDGTADRYEITNNTVKFYLSDIDSEGVNLNFKIKEVAKCLDRQPASVSAYEYYEPDIRCTKFYSMEGDYNIRTSCQKAAGEQKEICTCSEDECSKCRKWDETLTDTNCQSTERHKNKTCNELNVCSSGNCYNIHADSCSGDYLYVIQVEDVGFDVTPGYRSFTANVTEVFRNSTSHANALGSVVKFLMRDDCYDACRDDDRYQRIADKKTAANRRKGIQPAKVEPQHFIAENRVLLVFDTKEPYKIDGRYVYELGEEGHLEATLSKNQCICNKDDKKCKKRLTEEKEKVCKIKSLLRDAHNRGCDV